MKFNDIVSEYMIESVQNVRKSVNKLNEILTEYGIRYCVIGGVGLQYHDVIRFTEDLDILVHKDDKDKMEDLPPGLIRQKSSVVYFMNDPVTKVEVLYSGTVSGGEGGLMFPDPKDISEEVDGIPVISLSNIIQFKISSGMYSKSNREFKDFGDVLELIRKHNLNSDYSIKNNFRKDLSDKYSEIFTKK